MEAPAQEDNKDSDSVGSVAMSMADREHGSHEESSNTVAREG